jgi:hypothetical protein
MRGTLKVRGLWGPFKKVEIWGGPWMSKPHHAFGICMAPEIIKGWVGGKAPAPDVMVHVEDFSTPDPEEIRKAACLALLIGLQGGAVYVGCGFGIGRTGTLLGLIARIADPRLKDPVAYVRENYFSQAIETDAQAEMVRTLNVKAAQRIYQSWLWSLRLRTGRALSLPSGAWLDDPHTRA